MVHLSFSVFWSTGVTSRGRAALKSRWEVAHALSENFLFVPRADTTTLYSREWRVLDVVSPDSTNVDIVTEGRCVAETGGC